MLDLGCGSGLSGELLTEKGHTWVVGAKPCCSSAFGLSGQAGLLKTCAWQGLDISEAMLDVAQEREVEGDLCHHDLGDGLPFRPGTFDGAISISAVQWLCNAVRSPR